MTLAPSVPITTQLEMLKLHDSRTVLGVKSIPLAEALVRVTSPKKFVKKLSRL